MLRGALIIIENERELNGTIVNTANLSVLAIILYYLYNHSSVSYDGFFIAIYIALFIA
jgi:hypothetical protein